MSNAPKYTGKVRRGFVHILTAIEEKADIRAERNPAVFLQLLRIHPLHDTMTAEQRDDYETAQRWLYSECWAELDKAKGPPPESPSQTTSPSQESTT